MKNTERQDAKSAKWNQMMSEADNSPLVEPDAETDSCAWTMIGVCIEAHRELGAGLDEALYESAVCAELRRRGIPFERQVVVPVYYKGELIGDRRIDLIVDRKLVVELKSVETLTKLHFAQLRTYLRITGLKLGLLINFNVAVLKEGIKRIVCS